ncbi:MAG: FlgD immunoglobulin-like domain containing protein, partial [bacterium]
AAATAMPIGHEQYEMAIPIGTLPEELNCSPTDTLGMIVAVTDTTATSVETGGWWVQSIDPVNWNQPGLYGKLLLSTQVGIAEEHPRSIRALAVSFLSQNTPNPFKSSTTIRFGIARDCFVRIDVFDVAGRLVKNIYSKETSRGLHSATWDGTGKAGVKVSSGTYFLRMGAEGEGFVKRAVVVR